MRPVPGDVAAFPIWTFSPRGVSQAMAQECAAARLAALGDVSVVEATAVIKAMTQLTNAARRAAESFNTEMAKLERVMATTGDGIDRFRATFDDPPTDVRGRALWAKQHRGTGPDSGRLDRRCHR